LIRFSSSPSFEREKKKNSNSSRTSFSPFATD
jgi:hypothetical protein